MNKQTKKTWNFNNKEKAIAFFKIALSTKTTYLKSVEITPNNNVVITKLTNK